MPEEFGLDSLDSGEPWRILSGDRRGESCASGDLGCRISSAPSLGLMPLLPRSLHQAIKEVIFSSKVLRSKPFSTFQDLPPPCPTRFLFFDTQSCAQLPPWGKHLLNEVCALGAALFYFIFFHSFCNLQGEKPNPCLLRGGATCRGVSNKEMGNQIPSGSRAQAGCAGAPARAPSPYRDLT